MCSNWKGWDQEVIDYWRKDPTLIKLLHQSNVAASHLPHHQAAKQSTKQMPPPHAHYRGFYVRSTLTAIMLITLIAIRWSWSVHVGEQKEMSVRSVHMKKSIHTVLWCVAWGSWQMYNNLIITEALRQMSGRRHDQQEQDGIDWGEEVFLWSFPESVLTQHAE